MIYTLHTGGRDLGFKPHVHLVMTKGGLSDGAWVEIDKLPGGRLAAKWRYLLCKHLCQARPFDHELRKAVDQGYRDHRGYQVKTDSFYPKGLDAAKYIGRYLGHPPLATSHITNYDGQLVTYWYVDSNTHQRVTVTCSALDFISRMVPHIPPKGMQTIRYAGLYARNVKRRIAPTVHAALEILRLQPSLFDLEPLAQTFQHLKWRERIDLTPHREHRRPHLWIVDPLVEPRARQRPADRPHQPAPPICMSLAYRAKANPSSWSTASIRTSLLFGVVA
jgi:hypothetical protein